MRLGYARCSTDEQADALTAQVARLEAAGCEQIVQELERGGNDDRPGLAEVLFLVRSGHVSELLITRADRLGRHAAFADELLALCAMSDVTVRALDGGTIEAATPNGFFQARLLTTLAEFESRLLSQRVKRQFEVYRTLGRHLRRRKPFGYQGGADYKLEPHPEQWPQAPATPELPGPRRTIALLAITIVVISVVVGELANLHGDRRVHDFQ